MGVRFGLEILGFRIVDCPEGMTSPKDLGLMYLGFARYKSDYFKARGMKLLDYHTVNIKVRD